MPSQFLRWVAVFAAALAASPGCDSVHEATATKTNAGSSGWGSFGGVSGSIGTGGTQATITDGGASGSPSSAGAAGAETVTPLAPVIVSAAPMLGGIHLTWTNTQTDCDVIAGERMSTSESYAVVFSYTNPTANNRHDGPLAAGTAYTYRVRCKKGSVYSPYSNEMTATP